MTIPTLAAIIANPDAYTGKAIGSAIALHLFNAPAPQPIQMYSGIFADPNGNVTPVTTSVPALYFPDPPSQGSIWVWSVAGQNWFQLISP